MRLFSLFAAFALGCATAAGTDGDDTGGGAHGGGCGIGGGSGCRIGIH